MILVPQARQAAARTQDLQSAAREAVPDVGNALTDREREQLREQSQEQSRTQEAARALARKLREEVGGVPVSEQTAEQLESIGQPMQRAAKALEESEPIEAQKQQQAAADQLRRLRQQLESQRRSSRGSGGNGSDDSRGTRGNQRVEIPGSRTRADEIAWRRRVMDAMNGSPPNGYQEAVDDYYERLLR